MGFALSQTHVTWLLMTAPRYSISYAPLAFMRDGVLPVLAVATALMLPFPLLVHAFIVLGQAHFILTYLYQWRGKKMTSAYRLVALALLAGGGGYFAFSGAALPLMVLITVLFSFHFSLDEMTLHDEPLSRGRVIVVAGFTASFFLISMLFLYPGALWLSFAAFAVGALAILARFIVEARPMSNAERYLWFVQALLFACATLFHLPGHVLAVIVILHVLNWYVAYGVRLQPRPERAKRYWQEVGMSLAAVAALFFAYRALDLAALYPLFGLAPYYAWAVAHIALSLIASAPRAA